MKSAENPKQDSNIKKKLGNSRVNQTKPKDSGCYFIYWIYLNLLQPTSNLQ